MKKFTCVIISVTIIFNIFCALGITASAGALRYGDYSYEILPDGTVSIEGYYGSATEIVIPSTISGKTVTAIGDHAFGTYADNITRVTVPSGVKTIGKYAFKSCSYLTNINLPSGLTTIKDYAFCNCRSLTSINIPNNVEKIGADAFMHCVKLKSIRIPNKVKVLESNTFEGCTSLVSVFIPESVTEINYNCFDECDFLTNASYDGYKSDLVIRSNNESLTKVIKYIKDKGTLYNCKWYLDFTYGILRITGYGDMRLDYTQVSPWSEYKNIIKSVVIESGITSIADYAFVNCEKLNSITIPNTVSSIGENAFAGCSSIANLNIPDNISYIDGRFVVIQNETNPTKPTTPAEEKPFSETYDNLAEINKSNTSIKAGGTVTLKITNGTVKTWSTSNKSVATVSKGKVIGLKKGSAKITATLTTGKKLICKVTVTTSPKLSKNSITVKKGTTVSVKITGKANTVKNVYTNTKIAKVISANTATTIKVKGLKKGSTTLKAKVNGVILKLKVKVS